MIVQPFVGNVQLTQLFQLYIHLSTVAIKFQSQLYQIGSVAI